MSWKRALDTIDARIGLHLDNESGSLQHWRIVIGRVYANFRSNFLGPEHHSFASSVISVDGRSEGSDFPNLVLPSERGHYGF